MEKETQFESVKQVQTAIDEIQKRINNADLAADLISYRQQFENSLKDTFESNFEPLLTTEEIDQQETEIINNLEIDRINGWEIMSQKDNKQIKELSKIIKKATYEQLEHVVDLLIERNRQLILEKSNEKLNLVQKTIIQEWQDQGIEIKNNLPEKIPDEKKWRSKDYDGSPLQKTKTYLEKHWKGYPIHQSFFSVDKDNGYAFYKYLKDNEILWILPQIRQIRFVNLAEIILPYLLLVNKLPNQVLDIIFNERESARTTVSHKKRK